MASILVVEDDEQVRVLVVSFLEDEGHKTQSASTAEQATELLETDVEVDLLMYHTELRRTRWFDSGTERR